MAQTLTLTRVYTTNKTKDGQPIKDKQGRDLYKVAIKAQEYGDQWLRGFAYPSQLKFFEKGKTISAEVSEDVWEGQKSLRFRLAPQRAQTAGAEDIRAIVREELADALALLSKIAKDVEAIRYASRPESEKAAEVEVAEEPEPEDIPF